MTDKEILGLLEAYRQVYTHQEEVEQLDEVSYSAKAARAGEDIGKPGKAFSKIAKEAGKRYGSKERGEKVAGAVLAKLRKEEIETVDEDANYDKNRKRAAQRAAARNEARKQGKTGSVPGVGYVSPRPERETYRDSAGVERHKSGARMPQKEETDLFDTILEHLVAEGYADTNEAALAIMANMSEEWRESIVEGAAQNVANRAQKLANQRKGQTPERKATYQNLANKADERANPKKEADWRTGISDSSRKMNVSTYADRDEVKIKTTNPKKLRKQKAMGEH